MITRCAVHAVRAFVCCRKSKGAKSWKDPTCITIMCSSVLASIYGMLGHSRLTCRYLANPSLASSMHCPLKSSAGPTAGSKARPLRTHPLRNLCKFSAVSYRSLAQGHTVACITVVCTVLSPPKFNAAAASVHHCKWFLHWHVRRQQALSSAICGRAQCADYGILYQGIKEQYYSHICVSSCFFSFSVVPNHM